MSSDNPETRSRTWHFSHTLYTSVKPDAARGLCPTSLLVIGPWDLIKRMLDELFRDGPQSVFYIHSKKSSKSLKYGLLTVCCCNFLLSLSDCLQWWPAAAGRCCRDRLLPFKLPADATIVFCRDRLLSESCPVVAVTGCCRDRLVTAVAACCCDHLLPWLLP